MIKQLNNIKTSLKFAGLDAVDVPILADRKPTYNAGNYIKYGPDNAFPDYLASLAQQSTQMSAIIQTITDLVCGEDIEFSMSALTKLKGNNYRQLKRIVRAVANDFALYNGFAIRCIYNRLNEVAQIEYVDFRSLRVSADESYLIFAENWSQGRRCETLEYSFWEDFNPGTDEHNPYECIFYYNPNMRGVYPVPVYQGALRAIQTSVEIDRFHLANIQNGMSASKLVNFIGDNYTDDEKQLIEHKIRENFAGAENAGQILCTFSDSPENAPSVTLLQDDNYDEKFSTLNETTNERIYAGFRINPIIVGIQPKNGGFSKDEYLQASSLYNVTVIRPIQKQIVDAFSTLLGVYNAITIKPLNFGEEEIVDTQEKDIE